VRGVPVAVAAVAAVLCFTALGAAPFVDPPEGFHVEIAREMRVTGDFVTPRLDGVRYFDKPPVPYWLMSLSFAVAGPTPAAARFWPALAAVLCAGLTAWLGTFLGNARVGLVAGIMVVANLGVFLYGRIVKPDMLFVLALTLAWAGFCVAYAAGRGTPRFRTGLAVFAVALGLAAITKDVLGALGPLAATVVFLKVVGEPRARAWLPWWCVALVAAIALPWYVAVETANPGFLWYTVVDNHLLNVARHRVFPDEDVPAGMVEFLAVTVAAFLPWALAVPFGVARALARPWRDPVDRLWVLMALWALAVVAAFTVSPFRLPHYGLPAFPAVALLAARAWDEALRREPRAPRAHALLVPPLVLFAVAAVLLGALATGAITIPSGSLATVDVATRNLAARGGTPPPAPAHEWAVIVGSAAIVFGAATVSLVIWTWRGALAPGLVTALAAMLAFLPLAGQGMAQFARTRSVAPIAEALLARLGPRDVIVHEGALESSGALLVALGPPVRVVGGLQSNLAYGATFPDARDVFWDDDHVRAQWTASGRRFLVSVLDPERSVVRSLPPGTVHHVVSANGRHLYSNRADPRPPARSRPVTGR
jgi:4-amino-4-deoxy-L-arabinose transferase-like glycosyltransferase